MRSGPGTSLLGVQPPLQVWQLPGKMRGDTVMEKGWHEAT